MSITFDSKFVYIMGISGAYTHEEAKEIAAELLKAVEAAQPLRAVDQPSACPACGTLPEEMEHDPSCPLATAGN